MRILILSGKKRIQIDYLEPDPDPSVKFYIFKTTFIERDFFGNLQNVEGYPYYLSVDGQLVPFLGKQYTYSRIKKILERN